MENSTGDEDFAWLQNYAIFDSGPLIEYERLVGLKGLEVAINDCVEEARFRVDTVGAAAEAGDGETIAREARILKSLCETCGFPRLAELTRVVENVAKVRSARDIKPLIDELFHNLELCLARLETFAIHFGAEFKQSGSRAR